MSLTLVLFFVFGTSASQAMSRTIPEAAIADKHEQWMANYGRKYENDLEKEERFQIFRDNLAYIESFNNGGNRSYKLVLNEFADMRDDEFLAAFTGYKMPVNPTADIPTSFRYENFAEVPQRLDWREKGAVTPVKDQQNCGCCWAFSAVAAMEGITQIKTGKLISLSEQQLLDCTRNWGNYGCEGGWMMNAFKYVTENQGITTEDDYPYQATEGGCDMQKSTQAAATISGYEMVPENNEEALLRAVANQPVSVAIDAGGKGFRFYDGSGVFTGEDCGTEMNHVVTIVGFGTTEEGIDYWLIKNSWGAQRGWGDQGYMKAKRNVGSPQGVCGLAQVASYPVIA